jgi:hypothetical protein
MTYNVGLTFSVVDTIPQFPIRDEQRQLELVAPNIIFSVVSSLELPIESSMRHGVIVLLLHLREGVLYISYCVMMNITMNSFFWSQYLICLNYREYVKNILKANCTNCDIPHEVWSRARVEIPVFLPSERWVEKGRKGKVEEEHMILN